MRSIEELKEIKRNNLQKICDQLKLKDCIKGKVVSEENKKFDYIYFITSGEFEVSKVVKMETVGDVD